MRRTLRSEFVDLIPGTVDDGLLYISIKYATAVHKCCCGCGNQVVTPLSPMDWRLTFDGETVSLYPSIGNWNFSCQSHYWITRNQVTPAPRWSRMKIEAGREEDRARKKAHFEERSAAIRETETPKASPKFLNRMLAWLRYTVRRN